MQRQTTIPGILKRKRNDSSNIENVPVNAKRTVNDNIYLGQQSQEERIPFTDLSSLQVTSGNRVDEGPEKACFNEAGSSSNVDSEDAEYFVPSVKKNRPRVIGLREIGGFIDADVWDLYNDENSVYPVIPSGAVFANHPNLRPRVRGVLLDWVMEVAEAFKMHRETYYLALDYFDRYLKFTQGVLKNELQLIGITCLFIATKYEEIYPPKLAELAYVTDGACSESQILNMELKVIKSLGWKCTIITANNWLTVLSQLIHFKVNPNEQDVMLPKFSAEMFAVAAQLLDLVSLDGGFLNFPYKVIAATALFLTQSKSPVLVVSDLEYPEIHQCVAWMKPFWDTLVEKFGYYRANSLASLKAGNQNESFSYSVLKHTVSLELLESGQHLLSLCSTDLLTPPSSSKRPFSYQNY